MNKSVILLAVLLVLPSVLGRPAVELNSPADDSWAKAIEQGFSFTATGADPINCSLILNGNGVKLDISATSGSLTDVAPLPVDEGNHEWNVACTDADGTDEAKAAFKLNIDRTMPVIAVEPGINNTAAASLVFTLADNSGISVHYKVYTDGILGTESSAPPGNTIEIPLSLGSGTHEIRIEANDQAGNIADSIISIINEPAPVNTEPVLSYLQPLSGTTLQDNSVTIQFTATDDSDAQMNYTLHVDGTYYRGTVDNGRGTTRDVNDLSEGEHTWYVEVTDSGGLTARSPDFTFIAPSAPPAANTTTPRSPTGVAAKTFIDGSINVSWNPVTKDVDGNPLLRPTYMVFKAEGSGASIDTALENANYTTDLPYLLDTEVQPNVTYTYVITSLDNNYYNGASGPDNTVVITSGSCANPWGRTDWGNCRRNRQNGIRSRYCYGELVSETVTQSCTSPPPGSSSGTAKKTTPPPAPPAPSNPRTSVMWPTLEAGQLISRSMDYKPVAVNMISFFVINNVTRGEIIVERLSGRPSGTENMPARVYMFMQISKAKIKDADISNITLSFRVNNTWLSQYGINASEVTMQRFSGKWITLNTTVTGSDENYTYFDAETPGFSYFAVSSGTVQAAAPSAAPAREPAPVVGEIKAGEVELNSTSGNEITGNVVKAEEKTKGIKPGVFIAGIVAILIEASVIYYFIYRRD